MVILLIGLSYISYGQAEIEPNNSVAQALANGQLRVHEATTISGTISSADTDYWLLGYDEQVQPIDIMRMFITSGYDPSQLTIEFGNRDGFSYTGSVPAGFNEWDVPFSSGVAGSGCIAGAHVINTFRSAGAGVSPGEYRVVVRITSSSSIATPYNIQLSGDWPSCGFTDYYPACSAPTAVTDLGRAASDQAITTFITNQFTPVTDADGYLLEITNNVEYSTSVPGQFTSIWTTNPSNQYDNLSYSTASSTTTFAPDGTGYQVLGTIATPQELTITGLQYQGAYGIRVTPYNYCNGYFKFGASAIHDSGQNGLCPITGSTSNQILSSNAPTSITLDSWTPPTSGATGHITQISTVNNNFNSYNFVNALPAANSVYGGTGAQVVYKGSSNAPNIDITNLSAGVTYYLFTHPYSFCDGLYFGGTGVISSIAVCEGAPSSAPSVLSITNVSHSSLKVASIAPVTGADGYVVLANTTNSFSAPSNGALPAADAVYRGSGEQVVYVGASSTPNLTVAGLDNSNGGTTYYLKAFAYSTCVSNNYFENTGVVANATTCGAVQTTASNAAILEVADTFMDFSSFVGASGAEGHVVKINTTNSFTPPTDGQTSLPSANISYTGGEQVVYAGTSTNPDIRISGLSATTTYFFTIYTYSICDGAIFYNQTGYSFSQQNVKSTPSITFSDINKVFGNPNFDLSASSNATGAFTYAIVSQTHGGTILSGTNITIGNVGTVTLQVNQAADVTYNPGTAQATLTVTKADPSITFDNIFVNYGASDVSLSAVSNSSGTISYSFIGDPNGNVLSGSNNQTLTPGNAGVATIRASVIGDANYNSGMQDALFTVSAPATTYTVAGELLLSVASGVSSTLYDFTANPTLSGSTPYYIKLINGKIWGYTASGGANSKGTFFVVNTDGSNFAKIADLSSAFNNAGTSLVEYNGKVYGSVSSIFTSKSYLFSTNIDGTGYLLLYQFVNNFDRSLGEISLVNDLIYGVCNWDTNNKFIYKVGIDGSGFQQLITATDFNNISLTPSTGVTSHNGNLYGVAQDGSRNKLYQIDLLSPALNAFSTDLSAFSDFPAKELSVINGRVWGVIGHSISGGQGGIIYRVNTAENGFEVLHNFIASDDVLNPDASLYYDGSFVYGVGRDATGAQGVIYRVDESGANIFQVAKDASNAFVGTPINSVNKITPVTTFPDQTVDHLSVTTLAASSNSTGVISYELVNDATASQLSGNQFTAGNVGTITIRANVAEDVNFNAGTVDATFTIQKVDPTFVISDLNLPFAEPLHTFTPTSNNYTGGTIAYQFVDGGSLVTTGPNTASMISSNQLTVANPGTETIRATIPANSNFNGSTVDFQLTIGSATANLSGFTDFTVEFFETDKTLSVSTAPGVAVNYQMLTSNTGSSLSGTNNETLSIGNVLGTETIRVTVTEANYIASTKDITLTVNKATPVVSWNTPADIQFDIEPLDATRLNAQTNVAGVFSYYYGDTDPNLGTTIISGTTTLPIISTVTLYTSFTPTDQINYSNATSSVNINVTKINLTITADNYSRLTTASDPALTYTITNGGIASGHTLYVPLTRAAGSTVGTYAINVDNTVTSPQTDGESNPLICSPGICVYGSGGAFAPFATKYHLYNITFIPGTFTIIEKATITSGDIAFNTPASLEYNGTAKTYTVTPSGSLSPVLLEIDLDLTYEGRNGTTYISSATAPTNVGDYTVTGTVKASNADYTGSLSADFTITAKALTITGLSGINKVYDGATNATISGTAILTGAATGDESAEVALRSTPIFTFASADVATGITITTNYTLTGTKAGNYSLTQPTLTANITAKALTITGLSGNNKAYDGTDAATVTGTVGLSGTVGSDDVNLSSSPTFFFAGANVATGISITTNYTLTGTKAGNYSLIQPTLSANITARAITVTADMKSKVYGDSDPTLTYQVTNGALQGADAFIGTLTREAGENIPLNATLVDFNILQGTLTASSNYMLTFVGNVFRITERTMTLTIDPFVVTYGDGYPGATFTITSGSLAQGDRFVLTNAGNSFENLVNVLGVGTHTAFNTLQINGGGLLILNAADERVGDNYLGFSPTQSIHIDVSPKPITLTADAASKTYGDADPTFTAQITSGALQYTDAISGSLSRASGQNVGTYAIQQGTYGPGANYDVTFMSDDLTITVRSIQITADDKSKTIGSSEPVLTYAITNGSLAFSDAVSGSLVRLAGESIGTYAINQGTVTINANYNMNFVAGVFTINKATQSITFTDDLSNVDLGNGFFTLTASGGASGNAIMYVSSNTAVATVSGNTLTLLSAGTSTITASQAGNTNYLVATPVDQTLNVTAIFIWNGTTWNTGSAPTGTDDVSIEGNYTFSTNGIFEANNLTVQNGVTLTVNDNPGNGSALIVNGALASNGLLHVTSGASLVTFGTVSGTGYQIDRTTTFDTNTGRYSIVGSPIANANFTTLGANAVIYGYDQSELYDPTGNEGLSRFKTPATLGITEMAVGKGYFSAFTGDANGLVEFTGTPNTGTINVALAFTDHGPAEEAAYEGFNLVSNPYPSAIDFTGFMTANNSNINGSIYLWDDNNSNTARGDNADYVIVNALGNTDSRSNGLTKWDGYIRSGQGFFVQNTAVTNLTFNNSMRILSNNDDGGFYRTTKVSNSIKLTLSDDKTQKAAIVGFAQDATIGYDKAYDATNLSASQLQLYSLQAEGSDKLGIQGLPQGYKEQIQLGFSTPTRGDYTISIANVSELQDMEVVLLKDLLLGKTVNLKDESYSFTTTGAENQDRFTLQVAPSIVSSIDQLQEEVFYSYSTEGKLNVVFQTAGFEQADFRLIDMTGQIIHHELVNIQSNKWQMSTNDIPEQVYILMISTDHGVWKRRVITR